METLPIRDEGDAIWRALAHGTRRAILDVLFESPRSTGEIVTTLGLERHVVMAHLAILRDADLVTSERQGRKRMNYLNAVPLQQVHQRWVSSASGPWASAVIAVRDEAERTATEAAATKERGEGGQAHG